MINDCFTDLLDETGQLRFHGWRCVSCGEIVDPVIIANRLKSSDVLIKRSPRQRRLFTWIGQPA